MMPANTNTYYDSKRALPIILLLMYLKVIKGYYILKHSII